MAQSVKHPELAAKLQSMREVKMSPSGKKYSLRAISQAARVDYGHVHRVFHGQSLPSRDVLIKICDAIECSSEERKEIFHAIGSLSPEELEEESNRAA
jgi:hypothetical protein